MAELRFKAFRLPEDQAEKDMVIAGLTDEQATAAARDMRYWIDHEENLVIMAIPVMSVAASVQP